jgi:hypothetical protein
VRDIATGTLAGEGVNITLILNKSYSYGSATISSNGVIAAPSTTQYNGGSTTGVTNGSGRVTFRVYFVSGSSGVESFAQLFAGETAHLTTDVYDSGNLNGLNVHPNSDYIDIFHLRYFYTAPAPSGPTYVPRLNFVNDNVRNIDYNYGNPIFTDLRDYPGWLPQNVQYYKFYKTPTEANQDEVIRVTNPISDTTYHQVKFQLRSVATGQAVTTAGVSVTLVMNNAYSGSQAIVKCNNVTATVAGGWSSGEWNSGIGGSTTALTDANGQVTFDIYFISGPSGNCYSQCSVFETAAAANLDNYKDIFELLYNVPA